MTQREANAFMLEQFEYCVKKAREAKSEEEREHFTDAAHKLYITLTTAEVFAKDHFPIVNGDTIQ